MEPLRQTKVSADRRCGAPAWFKRRFATLKDTRTRRSGLDGRDFFIMKEDDVLAVVEGSIKKKEAVARAPAAIPPKKKKKR